MKRTRKTVTTLLATALITTGLMSGVTKADAASGQTFKDVPKTHWAYSAVETVAGKNLVAGYADGTYRPNGQVTRAELAAFLARAFDGNERGQEPFVDVASNHWAVDAINEGIALGFIKPSEYPNSKFEPNKAMTRAEIARWLSNGLVATNSDYKNAINEMANSSLTLIPIPEFFKGGVNKSDLPYIGIALGTGLLSGYTDATFKPNGNTSRAEVAAILIRYLDAMKKNPEQFVGLNELREVANTGSNMNTIGNFKSNNENRTFKDLRNEGYAFKNGIGTSYVNRVLMVDMRDTKKPKGIYKNMLLDSKGETTLGASLKPGGFYYGVEHRFVPSKSGIDAASYLYSNGRPELLTTWAVIPEIAQKFGFETGTQVNFKTLQIGKSKNMWFTGEVYPMYFEEFPNSMSISHTVNGKSFVFFRK
ncbi:MAG: S-layer homology domain-containing protein [Kurthia sp.]|nr:S-layer homology domain-containing protein [Candidatus Kurthia equi]